MNRIQIEYEFILKGVTQVFVEAFGRHVKYILFSSKCKMIDISELFYLKLFYLKVNLIKLS